MSSGSASARRLAPRVVLVIGGCGYLGSAFVREVASAPPIEGMTLRLFDNLSRGRLNELAGLAGRRVVEFLEGDILDRSALRAALQGVDTVVHLAAVVRTPLGFGEPALMNHVNHWGTESVLGVSLECGVRHLVFASSSAVYGPGGPHSEEQVLRPVGPYGQSKRSAEEAVLHARSRGLHTTILRFGSVFGWAPGIRFDGVVNRFGFLSAVHRPLTVFGSGTQKRAVVHVNDACAAIRAAVMGHLVPADGIANIAAANVSVVDLVEVVRRLCPDVRVRHTEQDVLEHYSLEMDATRARDAGWDPSFDLSDGIREIQDRYESVRSPDLGTALLAFD